MAMRLYTSSELEQELSSKWKLTRTTEIAGDHRFWKTPSGKHIPFPELSSAERYPDHLLDKLAERLTEMGENPLDSGKK